MGPSTLQADYVYVLHYTTGYSLLKIANTLWSFILQLILNEIGFSHFFICFLLNNNVWPEVCQSVSVYMYLHSLVALLGIPIQYNLTQYSSSTINVTFEVTDAYTVQNVKSSYIPDI